jgi:hypothetical protein
MIDLSVSGLQSVKRHQGAGVERDLRSVRSIHVGGNPTLHQVLGTYVLCSILRTTLRSR